MSTSTNLIKSKLSTLETQMSFLKQQVAEIIDRKKFESKTLVDIKGIWTSSNLTTEEELKSVEWHLETNRQWNILFWTLTHWCGILRIIRNYLSLVRLAIENTNNRIIISITVLLEIKYLHSKRRFKTTPDIVIEHLENDPRCLIYPVDLDVVSVLPTTLNIHDAVIVATAKVFEKYRKNDGEVFVLTKDREITNSRIVKTIW